MFPAMVLITNRPSGVTSYGTKLNALVVKSALGRPGVECRLQFYWHGHQPAAGSRQNSSCPSGAPRGSLRPCVSASNDEQLHSGICRVQLDRAKSGCLKPDTTYYMETKTAPANRESALQ